MKVNFSSNGQGDKHVKVGMQSGTFEDMVKMRKKQLPEIEEQVNEMLEDYDGGMIAIVTVKEDENGHATGHNVAIMGVGHISTQLNLGKGLSHAADHLRDSILEAAGGNPIAMKQIVKTMAEELLSDIFSDDDEPKKGRK